MNINHEVCYDELTIKLVIFHGYVSHNQMVISSHIPYDQRWFQLRITFSDSQKAPVLTNSNVDQGLGSSSKSSVPLPHHPPVVYNMSSSLYWKSPIWDLPSTDIYGTRILHMNPWQKTSSTLTHPLLTILPTWSIFHSTDFTCAESGRS